MHLLSRQPVIGTRCSLRISWSFNWRNSHWSYHTSAAATKLFSISGNENSTQDSRRSSRRAPCSAHHTLARTLTSCSSSRAGGCCTRPSVVKKVHVDQDNVFKAMFYLKKYDSTKEIFTILFFYNIQKYLLFTHVQKNVSGNSTFYSTQCIS